MDGNDQNLWERIKSRDRRAFRELYDLNFPRLYLFAAKRTGRDDAAEDIVQEAFLKIWEKAPEITYEEMDLESWMFTIVRNACYDWLRIRTIRRDHRARLSDLKQGDVHEDQHLWDLAACMSRAYARMPDKTADIFQRSRDEGLTYPEIAAQKELSVKSVEYHISKALEIVREELKDYLPG